MPRGVGSLRLVGLIAASLTLGACNLVVSQTPMYAVADAAHAARLRPGVWASPKEGCEFKASDPAAQWPECASGGIIDDEAIRQIPGTQSQPAQVKVDHFPYILAAGDPRVLQLEVSFAVDPKQPPKTLFYYVGLKPTGYDADGRITAAEVWAIQCGPPPPPAKQGDQIDPSEMVTKQPLPGMKVDDSGLCSPADKTAIFAAAKPSRAWADPVGVLKWIKDKP